jgi:cytochrome P450
MPQRKYQVELSARDRQRLVNFVNHGKPAVRAVTRARILLLADEHYTDEEIMEVLGVSRPTVVTMRRKAHAHPGGDMLTVLVEAPRPGQPVKLDSRVAAHVALIACSEAPAGAARWTLQLIADRLIELKVVEEVCLESVRQALKKMPSSPGCNSSGA